LAPHRLTTVLLLNLLLIASLMIVGLSARSLGVLATGVDLWVPKTVSPYATCEYSLISPLSRADRTILIGSLGGDGDLFGASGGRCWSVRCGRCRS
jgi:hypothetical protein